MYSKNSFGNYYPIDSAIHRLNVVVKYINFLLCILLVIGSNSLPIHLFMFSLLIVMMLLSFIPLKFYFNTFYSLRYLYIIIVLICVFLGKNLNLTLVILLKLVIIVEYLNIIIYTTSPSEMNYGIQKILSPFNLFNLNLAGVSNSITNAIRFIPLVTTTEYKILKSQASRGIDYAHSDIVGRCYARCKIFRVTLYQAFRKSKQIKEEAELRLFNTKKFRTNLRYNKVGFYDLIFLAFHILLIVAYVYDRGIL